MRTDFESTSLEMQTGSSDCEPQARRVSDGDWTPPEFMRGGVESEEVEFFVELIVSFRIETARYLRRLELALAHSDRPTARATAHCIKGGARQMGATALASLCSEIELAAEVEPAEALENLAGRLEGVFLDACEAMVEYSLMLPRN